MDWKKKLLEQGTKLLDNPELMRWATDERVLKIAVGLLDAPDRLKAASKIILEGDSPSSPAPTPETPSPETPSPTVIDCESPPSVADPWLTSRSRSLESLEGPEATLDGKRILMLGSNNFLGLTTHPKVKQAAKDAIDHLGTSLSAPRGGGGSIRLHEQFEQKLAEWLGTESALLFASSHEANLAACSALLAGPEKVVFIDDRTDPSLFSSLSSHASKLTRLIRFEHRSSESLNIALQELRPGEEALIFSDGVFSDEGTLSPLDEWVPIAKLRGAKIFINDAHGMGVLGPGGRGSAHHLGVHDDIDLLCGSLDGPLASLGAFLAGDKRTLEALRHTAPSYLGSQAPPPPCLAAAMASFELMQEEQWRIEKLHENCSYMQSSLAALGFEVSKSETGIIPIYIRQESRTVLMCKALLDEHNIYTNPILSPRVTPENAMLRTSYMATHERTHLDRALEAFETVGKKYGVIGK